MCITPVSCQLLASILTGSSHLAGAYNGVVCYLKLLALRYILCDLVQIRVPRQIQDKLSAILCEALVKLVEIVWLHLGQVENVILTVACAYLS